MTEAAIAALRRSPEWVPHSLDPAGDRWLAVRLSGAQLRAVSFLDARMLGPQTQAQWLPLSVALDAADGLQPCRPAMLFHVGHCGSTLLARLLGELPGLVALREPAALRTLAEWDASPEHWWDEAAFLARRDALLALWARPWQPGQRVLLKASSFASDLAEGLLVGADTPPALLLLVAPEVYLATILAQDGNRAEAAALAPARLRRLHARLGLPAFRLAAMREGERIAAAWATEAAALAAAATSAGPRAMLLDFDGFLAGPAAKLARAAAHLGADCPPAQAEALASGPLMARYSKGPEHGYSPDLRARLLAQARAMHGGEIAAGLAWLEAAARDYPAIAAALALSARTTAAAAPAAPAAPA
mgnify:CR=1 FL=1